jgi:L,D-transpeptidase ErfK/SrfK
MRPLVLLAAALAAGAVRAEESPPRVHDLVIGGERLYTVARGDSVWTITGRYSMSRPLFDALNALPDPARIRPGLQVLVSDRAIVPRGDPDGLVVDLTNRSLYWFERGALKARFPVGVGRAEWATPAGRYRIVARRENPGWRVPESIQREMRARGEEVLTWVPPGPDNPLGAHWLQLSAPGLGIHGTNAPGSIGKYTTHGCLRLLPEHVERLFREVRDGTPVDIVYEPVKLARDEAGVVYLAVHRDTYGRGHVDLAAVLARIARLGLTERVDPARAAEVVARAWGAPEDVGIDGSLRQGRWPAPPSIR